MLHLAFSLVEHHHKTKLTISSTREFGKWKDCLKMFFSKKNMFRNGIEKRVLMALLGGPSFFFAVVKSGQM